MSLPPPPTLVPRRGPTDLSGYEVPHPAPFVCELLIDDGCVGAVIEHVPNVEYVRWLDRAAQLHAEALGYPYQRLIDEGLMWFVSRHEIDYLAEVWPGDELFVATWVRDLRRVKSWRDYVVVRPRDKRVVCRAATLWVLVDLATRRPGRIPPEMARAFAASS